MIDTSGSGVGITIAPNKREKRSCFGWTTAVRDHQNWMQQIDIKQANQDDKITSHMSTVKFGPLFGWG